MAGFLYFVPGSAAPTKDSLREIGFDHAELAQLPGCGVNNGPGEAPQGYIFTLRPPTQPDGATAKLGYYPDKQTWVQTHGGKMSLGWEPDNPPTPADLQRKDLREGHGVRLHDGAEWLVPVFRTIMGETTLPTIFSCDSNGTIIRDQVEPEFRRVWELTTRYYKAAEEAVTGHLDPELIKAVEMAELACSALAMNYRVSWWECLKLGLLTETNQLAIFTVIIGLSEAMKSVEAAAE